MKTNAPTGLIAAPISKQQAWEELCSDRELLERLKVTPEELEALRNCAFLGSLSGKDDMLFILRMMRAGNTPEFAVAVDLDHEPTEVEEEIEEEEASNDVFRPVLNLSSFPAPTPESLAAIARVRVPEQLSLFAAIITLTLGLLWYFVAAASGWDHRFWSHVGIVPSAAVASGTTTGRISDYRILMIGEAVFIALAVSVTHWIYRKPVRRLKVRPY